MVRVSLQPRANALHADRRIEQYGLLAGSGRSGAGAMRGDNAGRETVRGVAVLSWGFSSAAAARLG